MIEYQNFIGIDIGKFNFVSAVHNKKTTQEYPNTSEGICKFITDYKDILSNTLIVVEATGGYELNLLYGLYQHKYAVHKADASKVKNYIQSLSGSAKTDSLDAKALASYGKERYKILPLFVPQSKNMVTLLQLVQRRQDLTKMLVEEKNRLQSPLIKAKTVKNSCKKIITMLKKQITTLTKEMDELIQADSYLKERINVLKTIPGIGEVIAAVLVVTLPELGTKLSRKQIASLAGVAPRARDSGKYSGYRSTGYGRAGIKPMLFLAAMAARNSKSHLKQYYESLIARGKKKMVALTALMRKIIVIANAKLKDLERALVPQGT
jgi:transposase